MSLTELTDVDRGQIFAVGKSSTRHHASPRTRAKGVIELMPTQRRRRSTASNTSTVIQRTRRDGLQTVTALRACCRGVGNWLSGPAHRDDHADRAAHRRHLGDGRTPSCAEGGEDHGDDRQRRAEPSFRRCAMQGAPRYRAYSVSTISIARATRQGRSESCRPRSATLTACTSVDEAAIEGAGIITTCTADKQYRDDPDRQPWLAPESHINAIGGDCPGKTELHKDILLRSDIFVEYPPQTRIEGEIQQMAPELPRSPNSGKSLQVMQPGRYERPTRSRCSTVSVLPSKTSRRSATSAIGSTGTAFYQELDIIADPDEPRDLFGMLLRAKA